MNSRVTIRMGAANWDATVRDANGNPVRFDLKAMGKPERRTFTKELVKAFREATV